MVEITETDMFILTHWDLPVGEIARRTKSHQSWISKRRKALINEIIPHFVSIYNDLRELDIVREDGSLTVKIHRGRKK